MNYYLVFLCNWVSETNAIVRSVELTTVPPVKYVNSTNPYVYLDLTDHLKHDVVRPYGNTLQEVMSTLVRDIGYISINKRADATLTIRMSDVNRATDFPGTRRITSWNDVAKPAIQRLCHASSFGTL